MSTRGNDVVDAVTTCISATYRIKVSRPLQTSPVFYSKTQTNENTSHGQELRRVTYPHLRNFILGLEKESVTCSQ